MDLPRFGGHGEIHLMKLHKHQLAAAGAQNRPRLVGNDSARENRSPVSSPADNHSGSPIVAAPLSDTHRDKQHSSDARFGTRVSV
jgi:hypothetical protein